MPRTHVFDKNTYNYVTEVGRTELGILLSEPRNVVVDNGFIYIVSGNGHEVVISSSSLRGARF